MLCDGLFPSERSLENAEGEEEERRLFYVAVTRAKNELYLSYPLLRAGYGNTGATLQQRLGAGHDLVVGVDRRLPPDGDARGAGGGGEGIPQAPDVRLAEAPLRHRGQRDEQHVGLALAAAAVAVDLRAGRVHPVGEDAVVLDDPLLPEVLLGEAVHPDATRVVGVLRHLVGDAHAVDARVVVEAARELGEALAGLGLVPAAVRLPVALLHQAAAGDGEHAVGQEVENLLLAADPDHHVGPEAVDFVDAVRERHRLGARLRAERPGPVVAHGGRGARLRRMGRGGEGEEREDDGARGAQVAGAGLHGAVMTWIVIDAVAVFAALSVAEAVIT